MSVGDGRMATLTSGNLFTRILSLPHEFLQSILSSITNFEPWTYGSIPQRTVTSMTDEDLSVYSRVAGPLNLSAINRHILGLSSESDWLMMVLAQHPYHLSRRDNAGISAAITQALRRMNSRIEREHWEERVDRAGLQIPRTSGCAQPRGLGLRTLHNEPDDRNALGSKSKPTSMKQYHATVQPEEEAYCHEDTSGAIRTAETVEHTSSSPTAIIAYSPTPVLKLSGLDIVHLAHQHDIQTALQHNMALLITILIALTQFRLSVLSHLEREREHDTKAPATPDLSPRPDRSRSLSGSTVADPFPRYEPLSFSPISTVCDLESLPGKVKWVEKRGTEEEDTGSSPKRPKLSEYKQVSSGRVASLMDRFERFHL